MLLVHGGAAAEGSSVPGSLAHAGRSARSLTCVVSPGGHRATGLYARHRPPGRARRWAAGEVDEPPDARGALAVQRCAALATEVSAVLTQMCAGHPASAAGKLHPKSKVDSEGGARGWTAGLPAWIRSRGSRGQGRAGTPLETFSAPS